MRVYFPPLAFILLLSCNKPGNDPIQPTPPGDSAKAGSVINFGKLVFLTDSFRVYDANSGKLIVYAGPYNGLFNNDGMNVVTADSLAYQPGLSSLLAVNVRTGKIQFRTIYGSGGSSDLKAGVPIVDGPFIYQSGFNGSGIVKIFCFNKTTGATVWQSDSSLGPDHDDYISGITETTPNILVNGIDGPACFSKATGQLIWRNNSAAEYSNLDQWPSTYGDSLLFELASVTRTVYAFKAATGQLLWRTVLNNDEYLNSLSVYAAGQMAYVVTRSEVGSGMFLYSLDLSSGQVLGKLSYPTADWGIQFYGPYYFTFENLASTFFPQRVVKHQLTTGNIIWSKDLVGGTYYGNIMTPGYIYLTETDPVNTSSWQNLDILDQNTGKMVEQFPVYTDINFLPVLLDSSNRAFRPDGW